MAKNLWDEIKNLFKTKQQLAEEEAQAIGDANKKEQEVIKLLAELEKQYNDSQPKEEKQNLDELFPPTLELERVDYKPKTDEEIAELAKEELKGDLSEKQKKIEDSVEQKIDSYQQAAENAQSERQSKSAEIDELYAQLKDKAQKSALKKGIQRSSIIDGQLKTYDLSHASDADELNTMYRQSMAEIENGMTALAKERDEAMYQLDLSYASDLTKRIESLTAEREKLVNQAIEKNNAIAKKEADYQKQTASDRQKYEQSQEKAALEAQQALDAYEKEHGYSGEKQKNYSERYNLALEFYLSLDPSIAAKALSASGSMKGYLGNYYDKLYSVLQERANSTSKYV